MSTLFGSTCHRNMIDMPLHQVLQLRFLTPCIYPCTFLAFHSKPWDMECQGYASEPSFLSSSYYHSHWTYCGDQVGNQAFADYVDAHATSLNHINNKKDPIPILPGRFLGYHHPSGEIHIGSDSVWSACPGLCQFQTSRMYGTERHLLLSRSR